MSQVPFGAIAHLFDHDASLPSQIEFSNSKSKTVKRHYAGQGADTDLDQLDRYGIIKINRNLAAAGVPEPALTLPGLACRLLDWPIGAIR